MTLDWLVRNFLEWVVKRTDRLLEDPLQHYLFPNTVQFNDTWQRRALINSTLARPVTGQAVLQPRRHAVSTGVLSGIVWKNHHLQALNITGHICPSG